jgi:hypothetical protein
MTELDLRVIDEAQKARKIDASERHLNAEEAKVLRQCLRAEEETFFYKVFILQ